MKLSTYQKEDSEEIERLFKAVFTESEGEGQGIAVSTLAHDLMEQTEPADLYGFTAVENDQVVGSIFFSRLTFENELVAFILSPVAVHTDYQAKGVGQQLINYGCGVLKEDGVELLCTYGSPEYYAKVGFEQVSEEVVPAPVELSMPFGWLAQSLIGDVIEPIKGRSRCADALNNAEYW